MNYFIPKFDGFLLNSNFAFYKNAKYKLNFTDNDNVLVNDDNLILFNKNKLSKNFLKTNIKGDSYYFAFPKNENSPYFFNTLHKQKNITICLSNTLQVYIDNVCRSEQIVDNLKFSHAEVFNDFLLVYFSGLRNFVVIIDSDKVYATYYDEVNIETDQKYFLYRYNDSLNHGRVYYLKNKIIENYLVYLDNEDMFLKPDFVLCTFLDCVKCKNINYLKNLLEDKNNASLIQEFLPNFDDFFVEKNTTVLFNQNKIVGIYDFEINNNLITNINEIK